jgi:NAD(P)-dependent dehydrogenase (short-subunit alcohol dehydrogenase family)
MLSASIKRNAGGAKPAREEWMASVLDRFRLDGQVALITGGARGIGRATAEAFVAAGARAVLLDRDADEARRVAVELGNAEAHALDVTSETAVDGLIDTLARGSAASISW